MRSRRRQVTGSLLGGTAFVLAAWLAQSCGGAETQETKEAGAEAAAEATTPDVSPGPGPEAGTDAPPPDGGDPCWGNPTRLVNDHPDLAKSPMPNPASAPGVANPASYDASALEAGLVYDNVTHLTWLRSSALYDSQRDAGTGCGAADASVPTRIELTTLQKWDNADAEAPGIDPALFGDTAQDYYWSSTAEATRAGYFWAVAFTPLGFGAASLQEGASAAYFRCVRRPPPDPQRPAHRYEISEACGRVRDVHTRLEWERSKGAAVTYLGAVARCDALNADAGVDADAGAARWRVPTYGELMSLVLTTREAPAVDVRAFEAESTNYWTSTSPSGYPSFKVIIDFRTGESNDIRPITNASIYGRCVRSMP